MGRSIDKRRILGDIGSGLTLSRLSTTMPKASNIIASVAAVLLSAAPLASAQELYSQGLGSGFVNCGVEAEGEFQNTSSQNWYIRKAFVMNGLPANYIGGSVTTLQKGDPDHNDFDLRLIVELVGAGQQTMSFSPGEMTLAPGQWLSVYATAPSCSAVSSYYVDAGIWYSTTP